jgi:hypothetical protein
VANDVATIQPNATVEHTPPQLVMQSISKDSMQDENQRRGCWMPWGKRMKDLGNTNNPSGKRPSEAQKQREFGESVRRTRDDIQIPALPTFDDDVMANEHHDDEEDLTGVQTLCTCQQQVDRPGFRTLRA